MRPTIHKSAGRIHRLLAVLLTVALTVLSVPESTLVVYATEGVVTQTADDGNTNPKDSGTSGEDSEESDETKEDESKDGDDSKDGDESKDGDDSKDEDEQDSDDSDTTDEDSEESDETEEDDSQDDTSLDENETEDEEAEDSEEDEEIEKDEDILTEEADPVAKKDINNVDLLEVESDYFTTSGTKLTGLTDSGKEQTELTIPDGITEIGSGALKNATKLEKVILPDTIRVISSDAFNGDTALTTVEWCEGIETLSYRAFAGCTSLSSVTVKGEGNPNNVNLQLPATITTGPQQNSGIFTGCENLKTVEIMSGMKTIPQNMFKDSNYIESVSIPDSVVCIGVGAFSNMTALEEMILPDSVETIENNAFDGDTALTSVEWCEGIKTIKYKAFKGCTLLSSVTVKGKDNSNSVNLQLPSTITTGPGSNGGVFEDCSLLTSAEIISGMESIPDDMFRYCKCVESLTIPASVKSIGSYALADMTALKTISLPGNVETIGTYAFCNDTALTTVEWCEGIKTIRDKAFKGCTSLSSVTVKGKGNPNDVNLQLPSTITTGPGANGGVFENCGLLTSAEIISGMESIPDDMFRYCNCVESLTIPASVKSIGSYAMASMTALSAISLPNSVETIKDYAFVGDTALASVAWCEGIKTLGWKVFVECTSLKSVSLINPSDSADAKADGLIVIPCTLETAGGEIWNSDTLLTKIRFAKSSDGSKSIVPSNIVKGATSITKAELSESVDEIKPDGLYVGNGSKLTTVILNEGLTQIDAKAFGDNNVAITAFGIGDRLIEGTALIPSTVTSAYIKGNVNAGFISPFKYATQINRMEFNEAPTGQASIVAPNIASNADNIKSVQMAESIVQVGDCAFYNSGLTGEVTLTKNIAEIGVSAFASCKSVTKFNLPATQKLETVHASAFSDNVITEIDIPAVAGQVIESKALANNANLTTVKFSEGLTQFADDIFEGSTAITQIGVGSKLEAGTAVVPSTVTNAHYGKSVENNYNIPTSPYASLSNINKLAFNNASGEATSIVPAAIAYNASNIKSVEFADSNISIEKYAFAGSGLEGTVTLTDNITAIKEYAFNDCVTVAEFKLPQKLESIDQYSFAECEKISAISIPAGTKTIGQRAFYNDIMLEKVTWGEGLETIWGNIFEESDEIESIGIGELQENGTVYIPSTLKKIESDGGYYSNQSPFKNLSKIEKIVFNSNADGADCVVPAYIAYYAENLKEVELSDTIKTIEDYAFAYSGISGEVVITNKVTSIGDYAFYGCSGMESVTIRDQVEHIGDNAFSGCGYNVLFRVYKNSYAHRFLKNKGYSLFEFIPKTVNDFEIDSNLQLMVGDSAVISYETTPKDALADKEEWTPSDPNGIKVTPVVGQKKALVKGLKGGDYTISVKLDGIVKDVNVSVVDEITLDYGYEENFVQKTEQVPAKYQEKIGALANTPVRDGYLFLGWYTMSDGQGVRYTEMTPLERDTLTLYASWQKIEKEKMYVAPIGDVTYTGKPIKPAIRVYNGDILLTEGKDYTVTFKDNTKVGTAQVTVKGKGNYSDTVNTSFKINPVLMTDDSISVADIYTKVSYKKGVAVEQKAKPVVYYGKTKLKYGTDYELDYPDDSEEAEEGAYTKAGVYKITIKGKGNYDKQRTVKLTIADDEATLISGLKFDKVKAQPYTGEEIKPGITIRKNKEVLKPNRDYVIGYRNNVEIGTATMIITGRGNYSGVKEITFSITGTKLSTAKFDSTKLDQENAIIAKNGTISAYYYTGDAILPVGAEGAENDVAEGILYLAKTKKEPQKNLVKGKDYVVSYQNNIKKGTATIIFTGINEYTGTVKKTFKINALDPNKKTDSGISVIAADTVTYAKGGCKPDITVKLGEAVLKEGVDYTVSYSNNKAVYQGDISGSATGKIPTAKITGKGNFAGILGTIRFNITPQDLGNLIVNCADKVAKAGSSGFNKTTVSVVDLDGKALKAGTDYVIGKYTYAEATEVTQKSRTGTVAIEREQDEEVNKADIVPAGTVINVEIQYKGNNYTGITSGQFRVTGYAISGVKVGKIEMTYTGEEIELVENDEPVEQLKNAISYKFADGYKLLEYGANYVIVPGTYTKNVNKGKASVTIKGVNDFGGTKVITFNIVTKPIRDPEE